MGRVVIGNPGVVAQLGDKDEAEACEAPQILFGGIPIIKGQIGTGNVVTDRPIDEDAGKLVLGAVASDEVSVMPKHHGDRHAQYAIGPDQDDEALPDDMPFLGMIVAWIRSADIAGKGLGDEHIIQNQVAGTQRLQDQQDPDDHLIVERRELVG